MTDLVNEIIAGVIPAEWQLSTIVNCYRVKEDALEKGKCRGLKLTNQIVDKATGDINEMQFGFIPGRGTTNAFFILIQLKENLLKNYFYFVFENQEKASYGVPWNVAWWALKELGIKEQLVKILQSEYRNARNRVKVSDTFSDYFTDFDRITLGRSTKSFVICHGNRMIIQGNQMGMSIRIALC